jgi:hypothetical protein
MISETHDYKILLKAMDEITTKIHEYLNYYQINNLIKLNVETSQYESDSQQPQRGANVPTQESVGIQNRRKN